MPIQSDDLWATADLELLLASESPLEPCTTQAKILIPPSSSDYGVISDIDDTIVQTGATNLINTLRTIFFKDASARLPVPGFSLFYRSLHNGISGMSRNPLFYVSSSPWNLYDLLFDFIKLHEIPLDPVLLLRDYDITREDVFLSGHTRHKLKYIQIILDMYPAMPFILIGDNGQDDPEVYAQIDQQYPDRIMAIYFREVDKSTERSGEIQSLLDKCPETRSKTIFADDILQMASHARDMRWIIDNSLNDAV